MTPIFQRVTGELITELLALMQELYQHTGMPWSESTAKVSLSELLGNPEKGAAWLIRVEDEPVGYFVLTLAFSLEFGGTFALLDELYIRPPQRSHGIGSATMRFVEEQSRELGAGTLRLETGYDNPDAVRFYERHGLSREQ